MYGADYAWILHEIVGPKWWKEGTHECNQKQLEEASENLLVVSSHNSIVGGAISYSGLVRHNTLILKVFFLCNYFTHKHTDKHVRGKVDLMPRYI